MKIATALTSLAFAWSMVGCASQEPVFEGRHFLNRAMTRTIFDDQIANSIVSEHTVYPHHFVADSAELNPVGEQHLNVLSHHYKSNLDPTLNTKESARSVSVSFEYDKDGLGDKAKATLDTAAVTLNASPLAGVVVTGRADARGSYDYNRDLGRRRAAEVREYLVSKGISADRIEIVSRGKLDAAAAIDDEGGMARDRNARFKIVGMVSGPSAELNVRQGRASNELYGARVDTVVRRMEEEGVKLSLLSIADGFAGGEGMSSERVVIILNADTELTISRTSGGGLSVSKSLSGKGMRETASKSSIGK